MLDCVVFNGCAKRYDGEYIVTAHCLRNFTVSLSWAFIFMKNICRDQKATLKTNAVEDGLLLNRLRLMGLYKCSITLHYVMWPVEVLRRPQF